MNLAGTEYTLESKSFDIFVSGCTRGCPGCFNPEAQSFDFGELLDLLQLIRKITDNDNIIENIRIMGGDLLCSPGDEAKKLAWTLKLGYPQKKLWLFTGADRNDIPQWCYEVFDVIKYGKYIEELRDETYELATTNQRYLRKDVDY